VGGPFLGQGEQRKGVKLYNFLSYDPFLNFHDELKNRSNYPFGPISSSFYLLFTVFFCNFCPFLEIFGDFFSLYKASDERVG
jgi:hypothetical protein